MTARGVASCEPFVPILGVKLFWRIFSFFFFFFLSQIRNVTMLDRARVGRAHRVRLLGEWATTAGSTRAGADLFDQFPTKYL